MNSSIDSTSSPNLEALKYKDEYSLNKHHFGNDEPVFESKKVNQPKRFEVFYHLQQSMVGLVRRKTPRKCLSLLRDILSTGVRFDYYKYYILRLVWMTRRFNGVGLGSQTNWILSRLWGYHFGKNEIICYPDIPAMNYILSKLIVLSGFRMSRDLDSGNGSLVLYWRDSTKEPAENNLISRWRFKALINAECTDISKRTVEKVFSEVFGYSGFVDPLVHSGVAVEKGDDNALHDGRVIQCPINSVLPGKVYMRLIDNSVSEDTVEDLRVPVFNGAIPFVYVKHRPINERFGIANSSVKIVETRDVFSKYEICKIAEFCHQYPIEYGELDVLRDRSNGQIYIVDVNKTPGGFADNLSFEDEVEALRRLWGAFSRTFLKSARSTGGRFGGGGKVPEFGDATEVETEWSAVPG